MERNNRTIYSYFGVDRDIIDTAYQLIEDKNLKENFKRRWGLYLNGTNNSYKKYTEEDRQNFFEYEKIFEDKINYVLARRKSGQTLKEIKESAKDSTVKNIEPQGSFYDSIKPKQLKKGFGNVKQTTSFFEYFYPEDKEQVVIILEEYKKQNHKNYRTVKKWFGENYDELNTKIQFTQEDKSDKSTAIRAVRKKLDQPKNKKIRGKMDPSFFNYFPADQKEEVRNLLYIEKQKVSPFYSVIVRQYGINYDLLDANCILSEKEKSLKWRGIDKIRKQLAELDNNKTANSPNIETKEENVDLNKACTTVKETPEKTNNYLDQPKKSKKIHGNTKTSFFDYFKPEDKEKVIMILEEYKKLNHCYYDIIVKMYGENYDKLNEDIEFTQQEKNTRNHVIADIRKKLKDFKNLKTNDPLSENLFETTDNLELFKTFTTPEHNKKNYKNIKTSFFEYFNPSDKEKVNIILNAYREIDHKYYKTISYMYGENYDKLNEMIKFTRKELIDKYNAIKTIKTILKGPQPIDEKFKIIDNRIITKTSFFDYFEPEDKEEVTAILEEYKKTNHKYHAIIKKWYGENYDELNKEIEFTDEDKSLKYSAIATIRNKIKNSKKLKENESQLTEIPKIDNEAIEKCTSLDNNENTNVKGEDKILLQDGNNYIQWLEYYVSKYPILSDATGGELLILICKLNNNLTDEKIEEELNVTMKRIDSCYIKYLIIFEDKIPDVMCSVLKRRNYSVDEIIEQSFLKEELKHLTPMEKVYITLKLKQYQEDISDEEIRNLLSLSESDVEDYQIMTPSDSLNKIYKLIKKQDQ